MKSKKASISATMTWITGIIALSMGLVLLVLIAAGLFLTTGRSIDVNQQGNIGGQTILKEKMILFLNKPLLGEQTVRDIVVQAGITEGEDERIKLFKEETKLFFENSMPEIKGYHRTAWLRIYKPGEEINSEYLHPAYGAYNFEIFYSDDSAAYVSTCNPSNTNALFVNFLVDSGKVLALCGVYTKESIYD